MELSVQRAFSEGVRASFKCGETSAQRAANSSLLLSFINYCFTHDVSLKGVFVQEVTSKMASLCYAHHTFNANLDSSPQVAGCLTRVFCTAVGCHPCVAVTASVVVETVATVGPHSRELLSRQPNNTNPPRHLTMSRDHPE